ncbi:MAG: endonuclease/exonuclease/phosphatase family protein [Phycisphaerales bacterium]|nr:endonuclease/exonuclease/phosphatase family protein [Phycisphaerales bacterium]
MRIAAALLAIWLTTTVVADETYIAFWNVENLFDTVDDPNVAKDEEFTPEAPKNWTPERYEEKLQHLSRVIRDMNNGAGPDVLGLAEVENRKVIDDLVAKLEPLHRDYAIVHTESPSRRGIDCALIYDKAKFELVSHEFHFVRAKHTRDIVEARLRHNGKDLTVFVNHWPSRGGDQSGQMRMVAAHVLRWRIEQILHETPDADFVVIGDLNDTPTDPSVQRGLRASGGDPADLQGGVLYDTMWPIHAAGKGTYNYRGNWDVIDHIIVSPGLFDPRGFEWKRDSTVLIENEYQMFRDNDSGQMRPNRTYGGDRYYGGYSDHLPVACKLES